MRYYKLLFFLALSSAFAAKGSMIPVHFTNTIHASNAPTIDQNFIALFKPIQCTGSFYQHDNIIILEKKDTHSLLVICDPQMVASVPEKNHLLHLVASKNQKNIESIITFEYMGYGLASTFQTHVSKNPLKIDNLVSLHNKHSQKNSFCFFVNDFQIIECTQLQNNIQKVKKFMASALEISIIFGCIYLLISFLTNIKHSIYS